MPGPRCSSKQTIKATFLPSSETRETPGKETQPGLVNGKGWKKEQDELGDAPRIPDYQAKE